MGRAYSGYAALISKWVCPALACAHPSAPPLNECVVFSRATYKLCEKINQLFESSPRKKNVYARPGFGKLVIFSRFPVPFLEAIQPPEKCSSFDFRPVPDDQGDYFSPNKISR